MSLTEITYNVNKLVHKFGLVQSHRDSSWLSAKTGIIGSVRWSVLIAGTFLNSLHTTTAIMFVLGLYYLILTRPFWVFKYTLPVQSNWPGDMACSSFFLHALVVTTRGRSVFMQPLCVRAEAR